VVTLETFSTYSQVVALCLPSTYVMLGKIGYGGGQYLYRTG